ncbi:MAG: glycosyltransferase [Candidatus Dormibacteria bacterium]
MRIAFVSATGGSAFMHELLGVVAKAVTDAGADVSLHVGSYPVISEPHAYVVVPHEYFRLTASEQQPTVAERQRTIGFCVEHPGNATFEVSAEFGASLGALFDINSDSLAELRRRGLPAERFTLGYSSHWDAWNADAGSERPVDITYMGTTDARRDRLLALQAECLSRWHCRFLLPPHEQMTRPRQDFLMGREKLRHLARSKVLLNLHRGGSQALEWVRVLEAVTNGCVVVSEQSTDFEPLTPGTHILFARPQAIAHVAEALLRNPDRLDRIRQEAYTLCRGLDMGPSATRLVEVAEALARGAPPRARVPVPSREHTPQYPVVPEPPPAPDDLPTLAPWAAALPDPLRRLHAAVIETAVTRDQACVSLQTRESAAPTGVAAIVVRPPGLAGQLAPALRGLDRQSTGAHSVVVVVDDAPSRLADFGPARGLLLNAAMEQVTEECVLILEAGHELFPDAIARLLEAINAPSDPLPCLAYGIMADDVNGELWDSLPMEPARLARRAYLSAPFMVRRSFLREVGGFSESPDLLGYEYHELLCRLVEAKHAATFVQEIIGRGQRPQPPLLSIAQLCPDITSAALADSAPKLLRNRSSPG